MSRTLQLLPGLQSLEYVAAPLHAMAAADAYRLQGANIGRNGGNLTISFLSLNRPVLSLRLLESIKRELPWFRGEVLIVDQGSSPDVRSALRDALPSLPCVGRLVELDDNYGVAGGRNRTMPFVQTDWVMCLDNDMVFVGDPVRELQQALALLGCHFLNLPLLDRDRRTIFARGGHLYLDQVGDRLYIGGGSACTQTADDAGDGPPFLSTFLFGGACVLNRHTFAAAGGYDEGMFIGFEDIDFSLRLFRLGYKIGNVRRALLVHDHPLPQESDDKDYERRRFSMEILKRSAEHLQSKHGFVIWTSGVEEWLRQRRRELDLGQEAALAPPASETGAAAPTIAAEPRSKPRVALVIDAPGWAFWNISQQIRRHLSDRFDFEILVTSDTENAAQLFFAAREFDLVHVFWREFVHLLLNEHCRSYVRALPGDYDRFLQRVVRRPAFSTCIYDHLHLEPDELAARAPIYRDLVDAYYVGSWRLEAIYAGLPDYPPPAAVLPDGVDPELFGPLGAERFENAGARPLVLGWTGNSRWGDGKHDYKGVHTILNPAIERLKAEGVPVELKLYDRAHSPLLPHREMASQIYAHLDAYVCTSLIEGTPNPVLESLACGVPIISTDVGIVRAALGPRQREFILAERSVECLVDAIRRLADDRARLLPELSRENLESAKAWYWERRVQGFAPYFEECLRRRAVRGAAGVSA